MLCNSLQHIAGVGDELDDESELVPKTAKSSHMSLQHSAGVNEELDIESKQAPNTAELLASIPKLPHKSLTKAAQYPILPRPGVDSEVEHESA